MKLLSLGLSTLVLAGCASSNATDPLEPRPGFVSRTLNMMRGSPDRIETAGRKLTDRLELSLHVSPEDIVLSKARRIEVTAKITNPTRRTLSLQFPTTQRMEIVIQKENGTVVTRWSEDRMFAQMLGHLAVNPGEVVQFKETISARDLIAGRSYRLVFSIPGYPELEAVWNFTPR